MSLTTRAVFEIFDL